MNKSVLNSVMCSGDASPIINQTTADCVQPQADRDPALVLTGWASAPSSLERGEERFHGADAEMK